MAANLCVIKPDRTGDPASSGQRSGPGGGEVMARPTSLSATWGATRHGTSVEMCPRGTMRPGYAARPDLA